MSLRYRKELCSQLASLRRPVKRALDRCQHAESIQPIVKGAELNVVHANRLNGHLSTFELIMYFSFSAGLLNAYVLFGQHIRNGLRRNTVWVCSHLSRLISLSFINLFLTGGISSPNYKRQIGKYLDQSYRSPEFKLPLQLWSVWPGFTAEILAWSS